MCARAAFVLFCFAAPLLHIMGCCKFIHNVSPTTLLFSLFHGHDWKLECLENKVRASAARALLCYFVHVYIYKCAVCCRRERKRDEGKIKRRLSRRVMLNYLSWCCSGGVRAKKTTHRESVLGERAHPNFHINVLFININTHQKCTCLTSTQKPFSLIRTANYILGVAVNCMFLLLLVSIWIKHSKLSIFYCGQQFFF